MAKKYDERACKRPECGKRFTPAREHQLYCDRKCRKLHWQDREEQEKFRRPVFRRELREWIAKVPYGDPTFEMIRKAVCSRIAKRQTPHGPGKKKRKA